MRAAYYSVILLYLRSMPSSSQWFGLHLLPRHYSSGRTMSNPYIAVPTVDKVGRVEWFFQPV